MFRILPETGSVFRRVVLLKGPSNNQANARSISNELARVDGVASMILFNRTTCIHSSATRGRTTLPLGVPDYALPWRRTRCLEAPVPKGEGPFRAPTPEKTHTLLEGFCPESLPEERISRFLPVR